MKKLLLGFILFYQITISPYLTPRCRFYPTCSYYAKTALNQHSLIKALYLIIRRISRCHPLGGSGVDFVPLPLYRYEYRPTKQVHDFIVIDTLSYHARRNNYYKN